MSSNTMAEQRPSRAPRTRPGLEPATVVAVEHDRIALRTGAPGALGAVTAARLGFVPGYSPRAGDRVLVADDEQALVIVAVLRAERPAALEAEDGSRATLGGAGGLELRAPDGRLVAELAGGVLSVLDADGLRLETPGRLVLAGREVRLEAATELTAHAPRLALDSGGASLALEGAGLAARADALELEATTARARVGEATLVARLARTVAERLEQEADRYELVADRVRERAREVLREASELVEQRAGSLRQLVADVFHLRSRRTVLRSTEDTAVDGRRILLG
ncbi:MAG: DUF3540 domain-containing protein [Myxococcales bacterium]|nr:DUF3540 domain-containing protein [Myxococcales bacterium]